MTAGCLSAISRVTVCCFAVIVILSGIWNLFAPADGADDPQPHFTRAESAFHAFIAVCYGLFLLMPPRFFSWRPVFWLGVGLRGLACALLTLVVVAITWFQAHSVTAFAVIILLLGATLCVPSALSVWELFYAHPNERNART